jgi:hypothetical protein
MRLVAVWLGCALVGGLLLGIGGRAVMRAIAVLSGVRQGFSPGGSAEVVVMGLVIGVPLALAAFAAQSFRPRLAPWMAVSASLLAFAALSVAPTPAAQSALASSPLAGPFVAALFGALFAGYGAVLHVLWRFARRRAPTRL